MQNSFVGDVGDLAKYALLRAVRRLVPDAKPLLSLGVVRYRPDDATIERTPWRHGSNVGYLFNDRSYSEHLDLDPRAVRRTPADRLRRPHRGRWHTTAFSCVGRHFWWTRQPPGPQHAGASRLWHVDYSEVPPRVLPALLRIVDPGGHGVPVDCHLAFTPANLHYPVIACEVNS